MRLYFKIKYNLIRAILYLLILPKKTYGVEIGVWEGWNAKMLYYLTRPKGLILIDPYIPALCDEVYQPIKSQKEMWLMLMKVGKWCMGKKARMWRTTSKSASSFTTMRNSINIDWIYIDGNHFDLYNDLTNWFPNIKKGGIIMGDDYNNKGYPKVKEDIDRFCRERNIKLNHFHFQWWFRC